MADLWRMHAFELADLVRRRAVSAVEVAQSALERLDAINPTINAVVDHQPEDTLAEAQRIDARIKQGDELGCLVGVPVTVKINADQKGYVTSGGQHLMRDHLAAEDGTVVSNLRKSGAVILGRTNMPAFGLRWFTKNLLHGATKNPRDLSLTPGGSSGGASAAVAAGIGAIGHGTDIAGSIRYPAYACGVHGLRPSYGRVPAYNPSSADRGIGAQLMAVSGPIARRIEDLRLGLAAMGARDVRDPQWVPAPFDGPARRMKAALCIRPDGLSVCREIEVALLEAARQLEDAGWEVEPVDCPPLREPARIQAILWLSDQRRKGGKAIENELDPDAVTVFREMEALSPPPDLDAFFDALQQRASWVRRWQAFLENWTVLLLPISAELPFVDQLDVRDSESFRRVMEAQLTQIALPLLGVPALALATGSQAGPPVGVQIVASRFREDLCLLAGEEIERRGRPIAIAELQPNGAVPPSTAASNDG